MKNDRCKNISYISDVNCMKHVSNVGLLFRWAEEYNRKCECECSADSSPVPYLVCGPVHLSGSGLPGGGGGEYRDPGNPVHNPTPKSRQSGKSDGTLRRRRDRLDSYVSLFLNWFG